MTSSPYVQALVAAAIAWPAGILCVYCLAAYAHRRGWVDAPGGRKRHRYQVPVIGGVGVTIAAVAALLPFRNGHESEAWLVWGMVLLCVTGWLDDRRPIRAPIRFALHLVAVTLACAPSGVILKDLGDLLGTGPLLLGAMSLPVTVVAVAGVANSLNLIDGLDGLAGGVALIALAWFAVILTLIGMQPGGGTAALLLGVPAAFGAAVLGFLRFNLRTRSLTHAEVFLGSSGAVTLGMLLGWLAVESTLLSAGSPPPVTALWVLAVPLFDTLSVMLRRLALGVSPARPDRRHLHHLLLAKGLRTQRAVQRLHAAAIAGGAIGVAGWLLDVPEPVMFMTLLAAFAAYHVYAVRFWARVDRQASLGPAAAAVSEPSFDETIIVRAEEDDVALNVER